MQRRSDGDIEDFYEQLQEVLDQTPKKDILSLWYKVTGMQRWEKMHTGIGKVRVGNTVTPHPMKEA